MWVRERMLAVKNMNSTKRNIFWQDIDLKNKSHLIWFFNWCKDKPTILLNIIHGTVQQLTGNNESEHVLFTLTDFMELEFRSWLCICEHEFLKLLHASLFEKLIDHNLIYDHDSIVCQELINSGILNINLAVFKLFIGDRNSLTVEKRTKLRLYQTSNHNLNTGSQIMIQNSEEVKTDLLLMTTNPKQSSPFKVHQSLSTTTDKTDNPEELPSSISSIFQQDNIQQDFFPINARTSEYDRKDKTCTMIMDETTLRIHFPAGFPKENRPSLKSDNTYDNTNTNTQTNQHQKINIQGQNLLLITLFPYLPFDEHTMALDFYLLCVVTLPDTINVGTNLNALSESYAEEKMKPISSDGNLESQCSLQTNG